jgi:hypothetical protein
MKSVSLIAVALGAGLVFGPPAGSAQERERQDQHAQRNYHFTPEASSKLREHYQTNVRSHDRIDTAHRAGFVVGGHLPNGWRGRVHAVPSAILAEIGPIPAGCAVGFLDGYAVVYDPVTGEIVETLDVY